MQVRRQVKWGLSCLPRGRAPVGNTTLIYHRVGGGSPDERDVTVADFRRQLDVLAAHRVEPLDEALDRLDRGDLRPGVVLTFDDGFADVYTNAWPLLRERRLPFVVYLATAYVGGRMHWDGSTARAAGPGLTWEQIREMVASGLCTVGNHTHHHVPPARVTAAELDRCSAAIEANLGVPPRHFAYPWGLVAAEALVRDRFRSAVTGHLGRNLPGADPARLHRVPVRASDPLPFFAAKLAGDLRPERTYAALVATGKRWRAHG